MHLRDQSTISEASSAGPEEPFELPDNSRRRHRRERRRHATRFADTLRPPLQRLGARREGEGNRLYVDLYRSGDVVMLLAIFAINIADAFFTLHWIGRGGSEGNPFMAWLLGHGHFVFVFFKCLAVGVWLLVLTVHKNFQLARWGLWVLLAFYSALFCYHVFLYLLAEPIPAAHP